MFVLGDSGALHAGTVMAADPDRRGATMAVQSLLGFATALGPLVIGVVLDYTGRGQTVNSWGVAFITTGAVVAMGPVILASLGRPHCKDRV